jgi:hypothetical protein
VFEVCEIIQFPIGDLEFRRTVRSLERFLRDCLSDGPKPVTKVLTGAEYISVDQAHFDEARCNLGIRLVEDFKHREYLALPGDEDKVSDIKRCTHLARREG